MSRIQSLLDQRNDFQRIAKEVETSEGYLIQIAYGFSQVGVGLAKKIEQATGGKTTRRELRPDVFEEAA